jgi:hypothetical protein
VLAAWACIGVGVALREGGFTYVSLGLVLAGWLLVAAVVWRRLPLVMPTTPELAAVAAVVVGSAALLRVERHMHAGTSVWIIQAFFGLAAVAAALTLLPRVGRSRLALALPLAVVAATGMTTVALVDDPDIDVWYLLQQSSDGLLRPENMYEQGPWVRSDGLQDVYPYLPLTTVLLAPARWVAGDVRYALLAACLVTVLLARRLAPGHPPPAFLPLLLVVSPKWPFLVDQSWTEPLLVLLLVCAMLALARKRPLYTVLALAVALACKQHIVLLLPVFAAWPTFGWRRTVTSGALAAAMVLPWWLASPAAFWHDAVEANLSLGVLRHALSVPSLLDRWDVTAGFCLLLLLLAGAYVLVLLRCPRTVPGLALAAAFVTLTLDLANTQSFFNHYMLPLGLLVVALCATPGREEAVGAASAGRTANASSG